MPGEVFLPAENAIKLLLLVIVGGGLIALGRWSSRLAGVRGGDLPTNIPTPDPLELISDPALNSKVWPPSAEQVAASLPYDPLLGKLQIRKFYFDKTDVSAGPAVPEIFADDLHIELYDPDSNHNWWQSFFIATPQGLAAILREKHWRYLHAPDVLVFPRYDLEEIRRGVVSRIVAEHDALKGKAPAEDEFL